MRKIITIFIIIILFFTCNVVLTFFDFDQIHISTASRGFEEPQIIKPVPNIEIIEDSEPWYINLTGYGMDPDGSSDELRWYLTGENESLYKVINENRTFQQLTFSPLPDAFGNDLGTLWLRDKDGLKTSQPLWINITPVNDPPVIKDITDIGVRYDNPYSINLEVHIYDVDTPTSEITLEAYDEFDENYITVDGFTITFNYPQQFMDQNIIVTILISDGGHNVQEIISIRISDNFPPYLLQPLPDIVFAEDERLNNAFDLDNYFTDRESDLYYSYSKTSSVEIYINENNSVDFSAQLNWFGEEIVVFRAIDSQGALVEDVIIVSVLPVNETPVISGAPDLHLHYDYPYIFDYKPYIEDIDTPIEDLTLSTDDLEHTVVNGTRITFTYPWIMAGQSKNLTITVSDGESTSNQTITVFIPYIPDYPGTNGMPIADAGLNQTVAFGTNVTFNGSGSSDNEGVVLYEWSFFDEKPITLTGKIVTHRFSKIGVYNVTLNIRDTGGHPGTDTMIITVVPESSDFDNDGLIDSIDSDDDNDGYNDIIELAEGTNILDNNSTPKDYDKDFIPDSIDDDIDGDGVPNEEDDDPFNPEKIKEDESTFNLSLIVLLIIVLIILLILAIATVKMRKGKNSE